MYAMRRHEALATNRVFQSMRYRTAYLDEDAKREYLFDRPHAGAALGKQLNDEQQAVPRFSSPSSDLHIQLAFSLHKRIKHYGQGAVLACPFSFVTTLTLFPYIYRTYSAPASLLDASRSAEKALIFLLGWSSLLMSLEMFRLTRKAVWQFRNERGYVDA